MAEPGARAPRGHVQKQATRRDGLRRRYRSALLAISWVTARIPNLRRTRRMRPHILCAPEWAVTLMRGPLNWWCTSHRMHDGTRDRCLFGCGCLGDCLAHYVRCEPLRLAVGLLNDGDPQASIAELFRSGRGRRHIGRYSGVSPVTLGHARVPRDASMQAPKRRTRRSAGARRLSRYRRRARAGISTVLATRARCAHGRPKPARRRGTRRPPRKH